MLCQKTGKSTTVACIIEQMLLQRPPIIHLMEYQYLNLFYVYPHLYPHDIIYRVNDNSYPHIVDDRVNVCPFTFTTLGFINLQSLSIPFYPADIFLKISYYPYKAGKLKLIYINNMYYLSVSLLHSIAIECNI
jgi:hypothetical protein